MKRVSNEVMSACVCEGNFARDGTGEANWIYWDHITCTSAFIFINIVDDGLNLVSFL